MEYKKISSTNPLQISTPVVFSDGKVLFESFISKYKIHKKGYFILAPSGSGKTHYIKNSNSNDWIDGDELWMATGAHPDGPWWLEGLDVIDWVDQKSDIITKQAREMGFCVLGASNYWLKPDAVVIPDWDTHVSYIVARENNGYDGGATSADLEKVKRSREWMSRWAKDGVPIYETVDEAVKKITSK